MDFIIRPIRKNDAEKFEAAFLSQGWHKPASQYIRYYEEQCRGERKVFVAADGEDRVLGYLTLVDEAKTGPFMGMGIPEIVDFNVLKACQRQGVGTALMDAAEAEAAKACNRVCLGVGLHKGYGSAQRMYVKRGYVPDGSGVWYMDRQPEEMAPVLNDDGLILYLCKNRRL